jgi:glucokinase
VTAEVVLSGPGLSRLGHAIASCRGQKNPFRAPNDLMSAAHRGDPLALEAARRFACCLGRFAGDLALTFEASGGVYIAGGIAPRMIDVLRDGSFREAFDRKAPHHMWIRKVPTYVVTYPEPALLGLAAIVSAPSRFIFQHQGWTAQDRGGA